MSRKRLIALTAFAALVFPRLALAAPPAGALPPPPASDLSMQLLTAIFGSGAISAASNFVLGGPASGAATPSGLLASMVYAINTCLLLAAAVIAALGVVNGIIHTAHSGQAGGGKYSTFWGPMRLVMTFALLAPIASGYSAVQIGLLAVGIQGAAIANEVESAANTALTSAGANVAPTITTLPAPSIYVDRLARSTLDDLVCQAMANDLNPNPPDGAPWVKQITLAPSTSNQTIEWTSSDGISCGQVTFPLPAVAAGSIAAGLGLGADQAVAAQTAITQAQQGAWQAMAAALEPAAISIASQDYARQPITPPATLISDAANAYDVAMNAALAGVELSAEPSNGGWLNAGSSYYAASNVSRATQNATWAVPVVAGPSFDPRDTSLDLESVNDAIQYIDNWASNNGAPGSAMRAIQNLSALALAAGHAIESAIANPSSAVQNAITATSASHLLTSAVLTWTQSSLSGPGDPLSALVGLGNTMMTMAMVSGTLSVALGGLGLPIAFSLLLAGAGLAVVLPLLPALIWLFAAVGWVALILEVVAVIPFVIAMNAMPSGEGWAANQTVRAEMLGAFAIISRPSLMVVGLFSALLIMRSAAWLAGQLLAPMITAALAGDTSQGITTAIVLAVVVAGVLTAIAYESARLITRVPDFAMRIFGGSARPTDPMHGWQHVAGAVTAAGGMIGGQLGGAAKQGLEDFNKRSGAGGEAAGGAGGASGTAGGSAGGGGGGGGSAPAPRLIEFAETAASAAEDAPAPAVSTRILGPLGGAHPTTKF